MNPKFILLVLSFADQNAPIKTTTLHKRYANYLCFRFFLKAASDFLTNIQSVKSTAIVIRILINPIEFVDINRNCASLSYRS